MSRVEITPTPIIVDSDGPIESLLSVNPFIPADVPTHKVIITDKPPIAPIISQQTTFVSAVPAVPPVVPIIPAVPPVSTFPILSPVPTHIPILPSWYYLDL